MPGRGGFGGRGGRGGFGGFGRSRMRMMMRMRRRRRRRRILLVGGLLAFGIYKMSKRDAERIEEHTGKKPEDMSDAELEQAMDELEIEKQYRDANDREVNEDAQADEPSYLAELERLAELKDAGIITDEDYQAKKKQLLGI